MGRSDNIKGEHGEKVVKRTNLHDASSNHVVFAVIQLYLLMSYNNN